MAAGGRVSIPAGARRTVTDIKEIAGGHSDEEVYAVLRECNMDPNETAQRLLFQDTFHEVKRKRDKKKEGSKELSDTRWRPAVHGQGGKSGRGNYFSRDSANSNDPAGRITLGGKDNGMNQITVKDSGSARTIHTNMAAKTSTAVPSLSGSTSNSASQAADPSTMEATNSTTDWDATKSDSTVLFDLKGGLLSGGQVTAVGPNPQQTLQSASDSVLVPFLDSDSLGGIGAPKQAIGNKKTSMEHNLGHDLPADNKGSSQQSGSSPFGRSSGSRPSSSYSNRSQQSCGSQKVVPNKEWKPKPTSITASEATEKVIIVDDVPLAADAIPHSAPMSNSVTKDDLLKVDKSFNDLQLSDKQHVIIPDHLQVSESEKYGLSFGSFNASFQKTMGSTDAETAKRSFPHELFQWNCIDDKPRFMQGDQSSSSILQEEAESVPQLPSAKLKEYSPSAVRDSSITPTELDQCRDDSATSGVPAPYSSFELAPHSHGNEIMMTEDPKSQVNNLLVHASSVSTSVANPAAGVIHTSIAIPQQSGPVFRQSLGVHLPEFPAANYVPYNQYISPFFIPLPTLHPFSGNATFPLPTSTGAMYPAPGSAGVPPPVKYPDPFKPGANTGSQASIGVSGAYGTYGCITSIYTSSTTVPSGNPAENDGIASGQFKENSIYIAGPQTEGSTLWVSAPGRDISSPQANSFYGYPQGQQVTFAPQAGHGPFGGFYHQAPTMTGAAVHPLLQSSHTMAGALEIVGTPGGVYQQPQVQMNWGNY